MERLEDINVMEGIDFKLNQKLMRIDERKRKEKLRLRKIEEYNNRLIKIAIGIALIIILLISIMIFKNDDKDINECISKGYSKPYCEKSIYGL